MEKTRFFQGEKILVCRIAVELLQGGLEPNDSPIELNFFKMSPLFKKIEIIQRLFLGIAMYCHATSSQLNE